VIDAMMVIPIVPMVVVRRTPVPAVTDTVVGWIAIRITIGRIRVRSVTVIAIAYWESEPDAD
jgi:hypothetical protein